MVVTEISFCTTGYWQCMPCVAGAHDGWPVVLSCRVDDPCACTGGRMMQCGNTASEGRLSVKCLPAWVLVFRCRAEDVG
jgi:hypothetical protein